MRNLRILLLTTLVTFIISACSVDDADYELLPDKGDRVKIADAESQDEFDRIWNSLSDSEKEFEYGYEVLNYYYLFAPSDSLKPNGTPWYKQLRNRYDYIGVGPAAFSGDGLEADDAILDTYFMFAMMGDQYTYYVDPSQFSFDNFVDLMEARDNETNVGVSVSPAFNGTDSVLVVSQIFRGSPAANSSLAVGDTIFEVNSYKITNPSIFDRLTTGNKGSVVTLSVARMGEGEREEVDISLFEYLPPTVIYKIIDSIAIIQITQYSIENTPSDSGTYGEFMDALAATEDTKATIIDLRGNPGGDGDQCQSIAAEFLNENDILSVEYSANQDSITGEPVILKDTLYVTEDGYAKDRYVVFMTNQKTGSCAEYHIASVTSNKMTPVVGDQTYGKGVGYTMIPSYLNGAIVVTIAMVFDRNKHTYHMYGILPDVFVNDNAALDTAMAIAKDGTRARTAGYAETVQNRFKVLAKQPAKTAVIPTSADLGMYKSPNSRSFGKVKR